MTLVQLILAHGYGARLKVGDRWLEHAGTTPFGVYERKRGARQTRTIIETSDEAEAVRALMDQPGLPEGDDEG